MIRNTAAIVALTLALALALAAFVGVPVNGTAAQGTDPPVASPEAGQPGREVLLRATLERTSADPVELRLLRILLDPGSRSPLHAHPGLELGVVESGSLVVRVSGRAVLLRAGAAEDDESEVVPDGVEVGLGPGDRIAYAPDTLMTFRNPGPEPATLLAATVLPAGPEAPPGVVYPGGAPDAAAEAGVRSRVLGSAVVPGSGEGGRRSPWNG